MRDTGTMPGLIYFRSPAQSPAPNTAYTQLGRPKSLVPMPQPTDAGDSAGRGPNAAAKWASSAAPVGVHSSPVTGPGQVGIPARRLSVAGAGTGKTLLALAAALEQEREYEQIILSRPTVVLGSQDIGFLPGDQKTKMGPFLQPLMDNLNVIKGQFKPNSREALRIESMLAQEKLIIEPLAYIRGRSLGKCYFIIDEAQNLTPHEVKTIITRAGEGTKMVFTGDIFQIDQPYLDQWSNGLTHLGEKMGGQPIFQHVFLKKGERSRLSEIASKLL